MIITAHWLERKNACVDGLNWFNVTYPEGADYKEVYLALESVNKDWGYWLLGSIGGTEFAIRVAMTVYKDEPWTLWANRWLDGTDRSESAAESARSAAESAWSAAAWSARSASWSAWSEARSEARSASWSAARSAESAEAAARSYSSLLDILDQCVEDKP